VRRGRTKYRGLRAGNVCPSIVSRANADFASGLLGLRGRRSAGCESGAEGQTARYSQRSDRVLHGSSRLLATRVRCRNFRRLGVFVAEVSDDCTSERHLRDQEDF
jgi:hypothetical protein